MPILPLRIAVDLPVEEARRRLARHAGGNVLEGRVKGAGVSVALEPVDTGDGAPLRSPRLRARVRPSGDGAVVSGVLLSPLLLAWCLAAIAALVWLLLHPSGTPGEMAIGVGLLAVALLGPVAWFWIEKRRLERVLRALLAKPDPQ
ncbi:hypothetical protein [Luteimonas aquatica]|uniref:hypothetical protein n=1 Tax=Luteimonas aquatica TaxID=450364 RepID=UPI001F576B46|nr:hypothetical protein [Luteimonas aquatica]